MLRVPWYRGFEFLLQREGYGDKVIVEGVKATMMLGIYDTPIIKERFEPRARADLDGAQVTRS